MPILFTFMLLAVFLASPAFAQLESNTKTFSDAELSIEEEEDAITRGSNYKIDETDINSDINESTGIYIDSNGAAGSTLGAESSGGLRGGAALSIDSGK